MINLDTIVISGIVLMYFLAGFNKISGFSGVVDGFSNKVKSIIRLPKMLSQLIIIVVILLELVAPVCVVMASVNNKYKDCGVISAYALAIFTVFATLLYHFPPSGSEYYKFMSNLTSTCGLLLVGIYLSSK